METIHSDDLQGVWRALEKSLTEGAELRQEFRRIGQDGKTRWIQSRGVVMSDSSGRPIRIVGTTSDISERKALERDLTLNLDLLNLAHDTIMVHDLENKVIFWNRAAEEMYGWTADEATGVSVISMPKA